jgi:hypothetical protein
VIGELDENDPNVLDHREQHLAQRFELAGLLLGPQLLLRAPGQRADGAHTYYPVHEVGYRAAKRLAQLTQALRRSVVAVKQEPGSHHLVIEAQLAQQSGRIERVFEQSFSDGRRLSA